MCFGLQRFRSPLLTLSLRFLFLQLLRCFTSLGSPPFRDVVPSDYGLPHSGIHDSTAICSSSWLFAACHALLRYLLPRHSPIALITLTMSLSLRSSAFSFLTKTNLLSSLNNLGVFCFAKTPYFYPSKPFWFSFEN